MKMCVYGSHTQDTSRAKESQSWLRFHDKPTILQKHKFSKSKLSWMDINPKMD